jgi:hypothetical protein
MPPPQGPIQGGLLIMRNGTLARSLLQWQHRQRARFNGSSRLFNQDQGALNGWYYNFVHGHWDDVFMYTEKGTDTKARRLRRAAPHPLLVP